MVTFLFWNLAKNPKIFPFVGHLAVTYDVVVLFLAECSSGLDSIATEFSKRGRGDYS